MHRRRIVLIRIAIEAEWVLDADQVFGGGSSARHQRVKRVLGGSRAAEAVRFVFTRTPCARRTGRGNYSRSFSAAGYPNPPHIFWRLLGGRRWRRRRHIRGLLISPNEALLLYPPIHILPYTFDGDDGDIVYSPQASVPGVVPFPVSSLVCWRIGDGNF